MEDILELATRLLQGVRRVGERNASAICPFHRRADGRPEKHPSFSIALDTGLWICGSCKEAGNLKGLLRRLEIPENLLDTIYKGVLDASREGLVGERAPARLVLEDPALDESVLGFFHYCPTGLLEEGFDEATLKHFDVGYDSKNRRITFPLRNMAGDLIGIHGRAVGELYPRYKTYTEQEWKAWDLGYRAPKQKPVWNFDRVYPRVYSDNRPAVYLVEGAKACMWVHQAGYTNVCALLGSTMTELQKMQLERLGGIFYLFFDTDTAGTRAKKILGENLIGSVEVKIPLYEAKQPTDLSAVQVKQAIENSASYSVWRQMT